MEQFASKLTDNFEGCQDCRWSLQLSYLHNTCNNILPNVYVKITEFVLHPKGVFNSWSSQPFYTFVKVTRCVYQCLPTITMYLFGHY